MIRFIQKHMTELTNQQRSLIGKLLIDTFPTRCDEILASGLIEASKLTIEDIIHSLSERQLTALAANHKPDILSLLIDNEFDSVRAAVAKHNIHHNLTRLKDDKKLIVRLEVAKHFHPDIIMHFAHSDSPRTRIEIAKHNHLPALKILSRDEDSYVRIEVAKHYNRELLSMLENDGDRRVALTAQQTRLTNE